MGLHGGAGSGYCRKAEPHVGLLLPRCNGKEVNPVFFGHYLHRSNSLGRAKRGALLLRDLRSALRGLGPKYGRSRFSMMCGPAAFFVRP
jgi:hypothetical protein